MVEKHLVEVVNNRAAKYGHKTVFRFREAGLESYSQYTWLQLADHIKSVSRSLLKLGFNATSRIGIFSDNRPEWTIADLGIMGIRGVVVPFFGNASIQQAKYIIDETGMELLFVGNQEQLDKALWLMENTDSLKIVVVFPSKTIIPQLPSVYSWQDFLLLDKDLLLGARAEELLSKAEEDDLATIIYTSGTTGEPKGVMLGQDNFIRCMQLHDYRLDVTDSDISLCFLPLSHIFERCWTFYMLFRGAINIYLENPKSVMQELPLARPTLMCTVPRFFEKTYQGIKKEESNWPAFKQWIFNWAIETGNQCTEYRKDNRPIPVILRIRRNIADRLVLNKLRSIFGGRIRQMPCAGAAMRSDLIKFFHATGLFVNYGYGATETTATVSCFKSDVYEFESCGTIMQGVSVRIGENGEIHVKGPIVFKGYFNKPSETSKVLKDGWYSTGDQGHISVAGNLIMEDRIHDIFKTSVGKYVSPQKIELLLSQDPFIEQVLVIGDNQKHITALIVPSFESLLTRFSGIFEINPDSYTLVNDNTVKQFFMERLEKLQDELNPHEKVVKFTLLPEPFSVENESLTSTLKLRRKKIIEKYSSIVEKMYLS
ncbi:MAG: long-chain fatty acid--CoA ligase [Bacteroidetes bacterium]|nr:long-chain fatty acid--CoA ligase [Bacteroidota bacterium]